MHGGSTFWVMLEKALPPGCWATWGGGNAKEPRVMPDCASEAATTICDTAPAQDPPAVSLPCWPTESWDMCMSALATNTRWT
jgi:hypothetical protein